MTALRRKCRRAGFALAAALFVGPPLGGQPPAPGLVAQGRVESSRVAPGETFTVWITFENRGPVEVEDLHFVGPLRTRGFELVDCWRDGIPVCRPDLPEERRREGLPQALPAGSAVTVEAELRRPGPAGTFLLAGVYAWREGRTERRDVVWVGPIEVRKSWADLWERLASNTWEVLTELEFPLLRDLGWPVAAFVLGVLLSVAQQRRAAYQQTWMQMLTKHHENAERHYVPISGVGWNFLKHCRAGTEAGAAQAFYFFALLLRRMAEVRKTIGGFYFKDRRGEQIVQRCWRLLLDRIDAALRHDDGDRAAQRDLLVASIELEESYRDFRRKFAADALLGDPFHDRPQLRAVFERFRAWTRSDEFKRLDAPLLGILLTTVGFEMNSPYEPWYARREPLPVASLYADERRLRAWLRVEPRSVMRAGVSELVRVLRQYRRRNAGRTAPLGLRRISRWGWDVRLAGSRLFGDGQAGQATWLLATARVRRWVRLSGGWPR